MTARQMYAFSYSLMVKEAGSRAHAEDFLEKWAEQVRIAEMEWRATNDPHWGESEEAAENLRGLFSDFSGATSSATKGAN